MLGSGRITTSFLVVFYMIPVLALNDAVIQRFHLDIGTLRYGRITAYYWVPGSQLGDYTP